MGRRSVWSHPDIIELTKSFVPTADEVWRLQRDDDPECRTFRRRVLGHDAVHQGTMQGTYVFAPGGRLLARQNSNDPAAVKRFLLAALETWKANKDEPASPPSSASPSRRWEDNYPSKGLVLCRTARDLPTSSGPKEAMANRFNRDPVWFSEGEARQWLPTSLVPKSTHVLPRALTDRLAGLVFVDNVRGQTLPFHPSEVSGSRIVTTVRTIDDGEVVLDIAGSTLSASDGSWQFGQNYWKPTGRWPRSLRTVLRGTAVWSQRLERFVSFEAVVLGIRRGRTPNCGRRSDAEESRVGYVLELAPDTWRVAPTFINLYDVPWVRHPESPRPRIEESFTVFARVKTSKDGGDFPALFTDKDWNSGEIIDTTSHQALGRTRTSGALRGFALALGEDGAWSWNLGDGTRRLDYRPPASHQRVNDGQEHSLAFTVDAPRNEARLHFDGRNVAIYSLADLGPVSSLENATICRHADVLEASVTLHPKGLPTPSDSDQPSNESPPRQLKVLAWNIWHGGRRDGNELGLTKTIEVLRKSEADVICMQETYGSGPILASALGFHFYLRSTNLSVLSRYPMIETHDLYQPFRFGGVTLRLSKDRYLKVFSLWLNHLPDVGRVMQSQALPRESSVFAAERATRGREIENLLATLEPHVRQSTDVPILVAGDFNAESHLDWNLDTARERRGLVVPWPVSSSMLRHGFSDTFRRVHPDPSKTPGFTWSPRFDDSYAQRIDRIYVQGPGLSPVTSRVLATHPKGWPSDHAAVLTTFDL